MAGECPHVAFFCEKKIVWCLPNAVRCDIKRSSHSQRAVRNDAMPHVLGSQIANEAANDFWHVRGRRWTSWVDIAQINGTLLTRQLLFQALCKLPGFVFWLQSAHIYNCPNNCHGQRWYVCPGHVYKRRMSVRGRWWIQRAGTEPAASAVSPRVLLPDCPVTTSSQPAGSWSWEAPLRILAGGFSSLISVVS